MKQSHDEFDLVLVCFITFHHCTILHTRNHKQLALPCIALYCHFKNLLTFGHKCHVISRNKHSNVFSPQSKNIQLMLMELEAGEDKDAAILRLQQKVEVQTALLNRLRLENSGLRQQVAEAEEAARFAGMVARDFRLKHDQKQQHLQEVETHLAILLDAGDFERGRNDAEVELLQQELKQKQNQLIKQEKMLQMKISQPSSMLEPAAESVAAEPAGELATETVMLPADHATGTETPAASEIFFVDSYAQTDGDLGLFPLRVAVRTFLEDIRKAENAFVAATIAQKPDRWADA